MKVLFVNSGNSKSFQISPFIVAQGESLKRRGVELYYFTISGKGFYGYIKGVKKLTKFLKGKSFDVIHAHYMLSGWVAVLSRPKVPIILSLMGDDAYGTYYNYNKIHLSSRYLTFLTFLIQPFLKGIICKSKNIDDYVYRRKIANIIPNGVNLQKFPRFEKDFRDELVLEKSKKYILYLGDTFDGNKNFKLVKDTCDIIKDKNVIIINPFPISQDKVIKYLLSVDVFVLSSFREGSANVIKEAMACNCPIVSTNAGDAKWVLGEIEGCYIADFDKFDFANKIISALEFAERNKRTRGRERLIELELDSDSVAQKIIDVYNRSLK
jgi:glycosyltransferase involved in cell wall biosynthesis